MKKIYRIVTNIGGGYYVQKRRFMFWDNIDVYGSLPCAIDNIEKRIKLDNFKPEIVWPEKPCEK